MCKGKIFMGALQLAPLSSSASWCVEMRRTSIMPNVHGGGGWQGFGSDDYDDEYSRYDLRSVYIYVADIFVSVLFYSISQGKINININHKNNAKIKSNKILKIGFDDDGIPNLIYLDNKEWKE